MSKFTLLVGNTLLFLLALSNGAFGAGRVTQLYGNWEEHESAPVEVEGGVKLTLTYMQCTYVAMDDAGKVLRRDICRYFLNDPRPEDGITEACNHWVYWLRSDGDPKRPLLWGRCPTKKHPQYKLLADNLGPDLWEVIPETDRAKIPKLESMKGKYGKAFSSTPGKPPFVNPKENDERKRITIQCIDLDNAVFQ